MSALAIAASCVLAITASAQTVVPVPIDDVDGDERGDLVVASDVVGRQLMAVSSRGDHALWIFTPSEEYTRSAPVVVRCADRDGDGARDLAAAWASTAPAPGTDARAIPDGTVATHVLVAIHSIRTGRVVAWSTVASDELELARTIFDAGDLDGDGRDELLLGMPEHHGETGIVHVLSGVDLAPRVLARGTRAGERVGASFQRVGDVDRDGTPDIAIGGVRTAVRSGRTGDVLRRSAATADSSEDPRHFWDLEVAPDPWIVALVAKSGRGGELAARIVLDGVEYQDARDTCVVPIGDWDRDGEDDVLVHDDGWPRDELGGTLDVESPRRGYVRIVGARGELARWEGERKYAHVGSSAAVTDDAEPTVWIARCDDVGRTVLCCFARGTNVASRTIRPTSWSVDVRAK